LFGRHCVIPEQLAEAQKITDIVCVQNFYNVANRNDDAFIDRLAKDGISYVPFFPLGGFTPLQSSVLDRAAVYLQVTPIQVALAWMTSMPWSKLPFSGHDRSF
jgi:aryl-alcohol dehydrogenase-like predicted oxidoreductase